MKFIEEKLTRQSRLKLPINVIEDVVMSNGNIILDNILFLLTFK